MLQEVPRALITPDEVMRLPAARKDVHGQAPIYGRQILYFRDPAFRQRAQVAAPATSDRLAMPPPPAAGAVPPGHVWLFSDHAPESFDARYFGPVTRSAIVGTADPLMF